MSRLKDAVAAGIITEAQRRAIEALEPQKRGLRLSMASLLWVAGAGLIVLALVLLAFEITQGEILRLVWVAFAYAAALFGMDLIARRRIGLALLSALLVLGAGICASIAMGALIEMHLGLREVGADWSDPRSTASALLNGIYLPSLPFLTACIFLVLRRGFLPAWLGILGVAGLWISDLFFGPGLDHYIATPWFFLAMSVAWLGLGWAFDLRSRVNHGFWVNKMGLLVFFIFAVVVLFDPPRGSYALLLVSGLGLVLFSMFVRRPAGVSVGAFAVIIYLGDWVLDWDNLYVATGLIALFGVAALYAGVRAHRIEDRLDTILPAALKRVRPEGRDEPIVFGV